MSLSFCKINLDKNFPFVKKQTLINERVLDFPKIIRGKILINTWYNYYKYVIKIEKIFTVYWIDELNVPTREAKSKIPVWRCVCHSLVYLIYARQRSLEGRTMSYHGWIARCGRTPNISNLVSISNFPHGKKLSGVWGHFCFRERFRRLSSYEFSRTAGKLRCRCFHPILFFVILYETFRFYRLWFKDFT